MEINVKKEAYEKLNEFCRKEGAEGSMTADEMVDFVLQRYAKLEKESGLDYLTGLGNKKKFEKDLALEVEKYERASKGPGGYAFAVVMLDLNGFKEVNDNYGHSHGDLMIKAAAHAIMDSIRKIDSAYRIGGDEFAVILELSGQQTAGIVVGRIKKNVADYTRNVLENGNGCTIAAGISSTADICEIGASSNKIDASMHHENAAMKLFKIADENMYKDKRLMHKELGIEER